MAWHKPEERPAGEIRRSQVLTTFGAGAMVDLTDKSVLIKGIDCWRYGQGESQAVIQEARLARMLAPRLEVQGITLNPHAPFRAPPIPVDDQFSRKQGIDVIQFPMWFVCQNPSCRALWRAHPHQLPKTGPMLHEGCDRKQKWDAVPVRFVATCKCGHLDEFPWVTFVHEEGPCAAPSLTMEEGPTGDFAEIRVRCACGEDRFLTDAMVEQTNPYCNGSRPWLGPDGREQCPERIRLLVRTATNSYFYYCESALSLPEPPRHLEELVSGVMDYVGHATSASDLPVLRRHAKVAKVLAGYSDLEVMEAIEQLRAGRNESSEGIRTAEFRQFLAQPVDKGEIPERNDQFFARRLPPHREWPSHLERVVVARKLREVRVQLGFTRNEPISPDLEGEFDLGVKMARVGLRENWLPATEIRGEGLFLQLAEQAVVEWEQRGAVRRREQELREGHQASVHGGETRLEFPGVRFYLLHSLSHLLLTAISLECGYSASAIRERIYCAGRDSDLPMAAILLSTGTPGSEGTLGGLVEQGRVLHEHLRRAWLRAELCANDPVCADHSPRGDHSERFLEGAACHGCLYVAEPSCERFNRYLDRALVVPTLGHDPELAFFATRP